MKITSLSLLALILIASPLFAEDLPPASPCESETASFPLVHGQEAAALVASPEEAEVVRLALAAVADDIHKVSGKTPPVLSKSQALPAYCVFAGTLGKSALIDGLVAAGKISSVPIQGQWERYLIQVVENPQPGVKKALVIAGSDRRGTAYGVLSLSRAIGVSPWVWWANVNPMPQPDLWLSGAQVVSHSPGVKYRGIFLNDEDWGLRKWAETTQDTDLKNIGPKTYARIFELLLRLRANFIWPAMHPCTNAFYSYPENPATADRYAIVVGSSHCEPMLRNGVKEWRPFVTQEHKSGVQLLKQEAGPENLYKTDEVYRFDTNADQVSRYWNTRVQESANYESIYTIGMRGVHDGGISGPRAIPDKVALMDKIIQTQQQMLTQGLKRKTESIPQLFCPYKEVLLIYRAGLKLPPEITLLWPDDNHGYMRQLSSPEEQKRSGRSGVYYHLSYFGAPADYLWLCSTSPSLISFEMQKALATGADRIWVFNVGDIKPAEMEIEFAMDLAWDPARWTPDTAPEYARAWAARTFGKAYADEIAGIKEEYYALAQVGKPEHVWLRAYSRPEAETRLARYAALAARAKALATKIPASLQDAYFQLVLYPTVGACKMNEKVLGAKLGKMELATQAQKEIQTMTLHYNDEMAGGQWCKMMDWQPRKQTAFLDPDALLKVKNKGLPAGIPALTSDGAATEIDLSKPTAKHDAPQAAIVHWHGLGSPDSVGRSPLIGPAFEPTTAPWVEYQVPVSTGNQTIHVRFLPTHAINNEVNLRVAVGINQKPPAISSLDTKEFSAPWAANVLQGFAEVVIPHNATAKGENPLRVSLLDPGVVLTSVSVRPN